MDGQALRFGGKWTARKLEALRKYLEAYTTALRNKFHLVYIDGFAGTGACEASPATDGAPTLFPDNPQDETEGYLKGSPRIALEIKFPFHEYVFIEISQGNCAQLEKLKGEYPHLADRIQLVRGDANRCVREIAERDWRKQRAVLFLDPFATEVEWDTVKAVAGTHAIDMWYLFPAMAVNRLLRTDGSINEPERLRLNSVFGSDDWYDVFYSQAHNMKLFGGKPDTEKTADFSAIRRYLLRRLQSEFAGVADNPLELRDERNHLLFLFCFAVSSPSERARQLALRIARHILNQK